MFTIPNLLLMQNIKIPVSMSVTVLYQIFRRSSALLVPHWQDMHNLLESQHDFISEIRMNLVYKYLCFVNFLEGL